MNLPRIPRITRRQRTILWALEQGWVAELRKAARGSRLYLMRFPGQSEASGKFIRHNTIQPLLEQGAVIRLQIPSMGVVWILGMDYYNARKAAFDVLAAEHQPRTTLHPAPSFKTRFRERST